MAGTCWRLLAAFLLILFAALLRGQDATADAVPLPTLKLLTPDLLTPNILTPNILTPDLELWRYGWASVGSPREQIPILKNPGGRYPVGGNPVAGDPIVGKPIFFPQIVQAAGIIFSGTVTSIARAPAFKGPTYTSVTFKVEHAMRGTFAGQTLTIHEWAGLWTKGERYRIGERLLLFLYAPSKLGLTSPVAGGLGRFGVASSGKVLITPQHVHILSGDPILGGKIFARYEEFAQAVRRSSREE